MLDCLFANETFRLEREREGRRKKKKKKRTRDLEEDFCVVAKNENESGGLVVSNCVQKKERLLRGWVTLRDTDDFTTLCVEEEEYCCRRL